MMKATTKNRLPGVLFQVEPPPLAETLPRMDIAAFVGLAASGPLHTPVLVEDVVRFRDIFGSDLPLAWDSTTGQRQASYLASTVEAFFRNGGRRCWVVRVAGLAKTSLFALQGLVRADTLQPAYARARSAGSWADILRTNALLVSESLGLVDLTLPDTVSAMCTVYIYATMVTVQAGDLLRLTFGDTGLQLLLEVKTLDLTLAGLQVQSSQRYWFEQSGPASPPGDPDDQANLLPLSETEAVERVRFWQESGSPVTPRQPSGERLSMELRVWLGTQNERRLTNLAFSILHPRFWGNLPTDEALFQRFDCRLAPADVSPLQAEASEPRFPLVGPEHPTQLYLPLNMPGEVDIERSQGPLNDTDRELPLQRDGLAQFSAGMFLDPDLAGLGIGTLLETARHRCYLRQQPLYGIYSLLPVDEITLIALPDAVQSGWTQIETVATDVLTAPLLQLEPVPDDQNTVVLSWTDVTGASGYTLQQAADPDFTAATTRPVGNVTSTVSTVEQDCSRRYYFRVRAIRNGQIGPWSNSEQANVPETDFLACSSIVLATPMLERIDSSPPDAHIELTWPHIEGAMSYRLEEAREPSMTEVVGRTLPADQFDLAMPIIVDPDELFHAGSRSDGLYYYRVRAQHADVAGPWSITRIVVARSLQAWRTYTPDEYAQNSQQSLLSVQRALLRFCAARGDLMAMLSLPMHYREEAVLDHVAALTSQGGSASGSLLDGPFVPPLSSGEAQALSFGALYHPWLHTRSEIGRTDEGNLSLRLTPPDGAVCGAIAAAAIAHGAWTAPANDPLKGVVALHPPIERQGWERLFAAQVNLVRQDPRGFLLLSANTLSTSDDFRPINVRRLLILLRRLAMRAGNDYVFAPNNRTFHRLVQRTFEQLLGRLYSRGAFAGNTAAAAFQVVTDSSVNTAVSLEQGRFIVELRVAPSRPMVFITVRLVQTGAEDLVIQEF